jgi:hypothetical protein
MAGRRVRVLMALGAASLAPGLLRAQAGDGQPVSTYRHGAAPVEHAPDPERRAPQPGLAGRCTVQIAQRPRTVAPGGAGELLVTLAARPGFALDPERHLAVGSSSAAAGLRLGDAVLRWRGPADGDGPVDTVVLALPFTVAASCPPGPVALELVPAIALREGAAGRSIGLWNERLPARIEVGDRGPAPPVGLGGAPEPSTPDASPSETPPERSSRSPPARRSAMEPAAAPGLPDPGSSVPDAGRPEARDRIPPDTVLWWTAALACILLASLGRRLLNTRP